MARRNEGAIDGMEKLRVVLRAFSSPREVGEC
jgi:hypothetical protein